MTRNEAIKLLSQTMDALLASNSWLPSTDNPIKEAFGMAIEALQAQESCNNLVTDTISRDKVLNLVLDVCYDVMDECETVVGIYGEEVYTDVREVDAILKCNKRIRNSIRQLPSEPLENSKQLEWIPRNKRSPEDEGYYLVSLGSGDIDVEWYDKTGWGYFDVVAWMPLPEPYQDE